MGSGRHLSPQTRVLWRNELRPGVDTSVDAADVGVCATTSDTEAQRSSSERKATAALALRSPDLPCRYSYRHLFPSFIALALCAQLVTVARPAPRAKVRNGRP